ncbi:MAG: glycosyltransferase [Bacteroidetes bacterium]|nr:glycosyltransferase [Bacteroidota bacterium]
MKLKITIVTVLYNTQINNSKTLNSIKYLSNSYDLSHFDLIIYDNSPDSQDLPISFPLHALYFHDQHNGGLSAAYNFALNYCNEKQIFWILLLDQDTELTMEYFSEIEVTVPAITQNKEVVAVIPQILNGKKKISPIILMRGGFVKELKSNVYGVCDFPVTGINSGTLLKVDFITLLGGFNPLFKMDMLDYWYFCMMYKNNKKAYIIKSILQHDLSVIDYKNVSVERYENIIKAELTFFRNYGAIDDWNIFRLRLFFRLIKQWMTVKNKRIARITFTYLFCKNV